MIIYVKKGFNQIVGDKIIFTNATGDTELETDNVEHYASFILKGKEQEIYEAKLLQCINNRTKAYGEINQDALRFDDEINGTTIWIDTIKAIKAKYPKPVAPVIEEL